MFMSGNLRIFAPNLKGDNKWTLRLQRWVLAAC